MKTIIRSSPESVDTESKANKKTVLRQRIVTSAILLPIFVSFILVNGWVYAVAITLAVCFCVWEELRALETAGYKPVWWTSFVAIGINLTLAILEITDVWKLSPLSLMLPAYVFLAFLILLCILRRKEPNLLDITMSMLPMLSICLPHFCMIGFLGKLFDPQRQLIAIMVFFLAVAGDTFAFFVGRSIGGPKLCPAVSPKKTISGAIGGLLGSVFAAALVLLIFHTVYPAIEFPPLWQFLICGLFGGVASQMGDLFASIIKRHCGIKDFSDLFPGHGGVMDRGDSIFFNAIIVYSFSLMILN